MEMDSMIDVENMVRQEDALKNSARRMLRKDAIGPLALPSVLTVGMMLILTNTVLLFEEKTCIKKGTIYSAHQTSNTSHWSVRNSTIYSTSYVDECSFHEEVNVKTFIRKKNLYVHIRLYGGPTVEGIQLSEIQWTNLKKCMGQIDSSIIKVQKQMTTL